MSFKRLTNLSHFFKGGNCIVLKPFSQESTEMSLILLRVDSYLAFSVIRNTRISQLTIMDVRGDNQKHFENMEAYPT